MPKDIMPKWNFAKGDILPKDNMPKIQKGYNMPKITLGVNMPAFICPQRFWAIVDGLGSISRLKNFVGFACTTQPAFIPSQRPKARTQGRCLPSELTLRVIKHVNHHIVLG